MLTKVIQEATKWIGYLEKSSNKDLEDFKKNAGYNNYTIFAKQYKQYFGDNFQAQPWCAMFVSCVFRNALGAQIQQKIMPHFAYCPTGVNQFKKMGCWYTKNPQKGDVVFFKDSTGIACHVGLVDKVQNNKVYTIEGNTSGNAGVIANGGSVCRKQYAINYNRIMGYGRPKYQILKASSPWQEEFFLKLVKRGYIENEKEWASYDEPVTKGLCIALIDKVTGGKWTSEEADVTIHWAQPHLISLCGKKVITQKEDWENSLDEYVSKGLILALVDKSTDGMQKKYKNITYDHWARAHLNSLCDKRIIDTPEVWCDNFEDSVNKGACMALICKAYQIK